MKKVLENLVKIPGWLSALAVCLLMTAPAQGMPIFQTDFNSGVPAEISGVDSLEPVQGFDGLGAGSKFSGSFLRNTVGGNPGGKTTLTLSGLPPHKGIELNFLLAVIDSWDGSPVYEGEPRPYAPDSFNVFVDGIPVFSEMFDNFIGYNQTYVPYNSQALVLLTNFWPDYLYLGFNPDWPDMAYDMGLDPVFDNIPHASSELTVEWFAGGKGWQGGDDESWAIDNVEVLLIPIPEPAGVLLLLSGLAGLGVRSLRKKGRCR